MSALLKENENDKMNLLAASANFSQLSLQQASEQIQLDIRKQECEDLRAEIASLNARIKELLPYERIYRVTKARQNDAGGEATEVAGLGDALGSVVERLGQTNDALLERLQAIEGALERSLVRSDEQLAYYVAQAREVVDLSLSAQRQITVDLQRLAGADAA